MTSYANIDGVVYGSGESIFRSTILPAIEAATSEVILVTCFWAKSAATRDALHESLITLSRVAQERGKNIRVRIGFSSSSLLQKLLHTSSPAGHTYGPSEWTRKLGLPAPQSVPGLDIGVKSIFFLPFSVWHPKFVIVDRRRVFLPSCNVSWEEWFEGCMHLSGPIVQHFVTFWRNHWADWSDQDQSADVQGYEDVALQAEGLLSKDVACTFLPSQHHRNPDFRLPWQAYAPAPETPLNVKLLDLFANARKNIYMQTPNVTCLPVLDALRDALRRGVDLRIVTSERLMIVEQLLTAGTTTSRSITMLIEQYKKMLRQPSDEEAGFVRPGRLHISYYRPCPEPIEGAAAPVQTHLKLTAIDDHVTVFGSGNMDRASWYTSQELGVAFFSDELTTITRRGLDSQMEGRTKLVYNSAW